MRGRRPSRLISRASFGPLGAWRTEVHHLIDLGGEDVLSHATAYGRPLGQTQQETQFLEWCHITSVRNSKVIRVRSFLDKKRAFEAAGLSE